jgi:hypothetical protein
MTVRLRVTKSQRKKWTLFFNLWGGTLGTAATTGLLYQPRMIGDWRLWRNWWNEDWQGKPKYSEKTCLSATLSTTNPTCRPDANPGRRGRKPVTNRLTYGAALKVNVRPIAFDHPLTLAETPHGNSTGNNFFSIFIPHRLSSFPLSLSCLYFVPSFLR